LKDPTKGNLPSSGGACSNTLPSGQCANVTYAYSVMNMGATTAMNITCTDSNPAIGTFNVPDLAPSASTTVTKGPVNICGTTMNHVECKVRRPCPCAPNDPKRPANPTVLSPCALAYPV